MNRIENVVLEKVHPSVVGILVSLVEKIAHLDVNDLREMPLEARLAVAVMAKYRHSLRNKWERKQGCLPFKWTASRALLTAALFLARRTEMLDFMDAQQLVMALSKHL